MANPGRGYDVTDDEVIDALHAALEEAAPRPVVESQEVAAQLDFEISNQRARDRLKALRDETAVRGEKFPKWLWWSARD